MKKSSILKNAASEKLACDLIEIWESKISADFKAELLNSERALQAAFYHHLRTSLDDQSHIFIEPRFKNKSVMIPDICVVNNGRASLILELKFTPDKWSDFVEDFCKFHRLYKMDQESGSHTIEIGPDTLFGFAVISEQNANALYPERIEDELQRKKFGHVLKDIEGRILMFRGIKRGNSTSFEAGHFVDLKRTKAA